MLFRFSGLSSAGAARRALSRAAPRGLHASAAAAQMTAPQQGSYHGKQMDALRASFVQGGKAGQVEGNKSSINVTVKDGPGALQSVLAVFHKHGVNLTRIESRPTRAKVAGAYDFAVDFTGRPGEAAVDAALAELSKSAVGVALQDPVLVPWFPTHISDIDSFSTKTLDAGAELESDHPGFSDAEYRERRRRIVEAAGAYRHGTEIPRVAYTAKEVETWGTVYKKLGEYTKKYAIEQYNAILPVLERECGYAPNNIPQLEDISTFLKKTTGFSLRPVGGLLSARDFLNGLAFRVFFSTQYLRHHTRPLYTPEPDIVHELLGHAPMFADPDFADFSHEIGLASLGASDEEIKRLATCYWFSVEFGLCMQGGVKKAYGAGLLSSFGELEYSCSPTRPGGGVDKFPEYRPWEPAKAAVQGYPITEYQPVYYVAESLTDAKTRMRSYCEALNKGFHVTYHADTQSVDVDRAIVRGQYTVTLQT